MKEDIENEYLENYNSCLKLAERELSTLVKKNRSKKTKPLTIILSMHCHQMLKLINDELCNFVATGLNWNNEDNMDLLDHIPNLFNKFDDILMDNNDSFINSFLNEGLKEFNDRIYRIKEINVNNLKDDDYNYKNKLIVIDFVERLNSFLLEKENLKFVTNIFSNYFAHRYLQKKINKKLENLNEDSIPNSELIDYLLDGVDSTIIIDKELILNTKDYLILMFLLEQNNLICPLDTPAKKLEILNLIIPKDNRININSTINNHYDAPSLRIYLQGTKNMNNKRHIAEKLRSIADTLEKVLTN